MTMAPCGQAEGGIFDEDGIGEGVEGGEFDHRGAGGAEGGDIGRVMGFHRGKVGRADIDGAQAMGDGGRWAAGDGMGEAGSCPSGR
jgi:hypothetical protein